MNPYREEEYAAKIARRREKLKASIEKHLPEFVKACENDKIDVVFLHQDAFAADYQESEYRLLGMAVKYAGLTGRVIQFGGTNRETLGPKKPE